MQTSANGLEGINVADTRTSRVDGEAGTLVLSGVSVDEVGALGFSGLTARFLGGSEKEIEEQLAEGRRAAWTTIPNLGCALDAATAMDALRGSIGQLDGEAAALDITAAVSVFGAAWSRLHRGMSPIEPSLKSPHAEDHLRMITSEQPTSEETHAMSTYLGTVIDHGMNASTFAARVVASTGSDRVSSVVAGLGALKGPLHGGAPGPVLDMLDAVGEPGNAEAWLLKELDQGRRIMGMGHRVYRVRDPRARVLESALNGLGGRGETARLELARAVERAAERLLSERHPDRPLRANVEFYTATLLEALMIPREMFTATFAAGRTVGWNAHYDEQRKNGRLIRPRARYVGAVPDELVG